MFPLGFFIITEIPTADLQYLLVNNHSFLNNLSDYTSNQLV